MNFSGEAVTFSNTDLGTNSIKGIFVVTKAVDPASIPATSSAETTVAVPGVNLGDVVIVNIPASLETGLCYSGARVSAANAIVIRLTNVTGSAVDGASRVWTFKIFKLS